MLWKVDPYRTVWWFAWRPVRLSRSHGYRFERYVWLQWVRKSYFGKSVCYYLEN
jgi:hypothetical protein